MANNLHNIQRLNLIRAVSRNNETKHARSMCVDVAVSLYLITCIRSWRVINQNHSEQAWLLLPYTALMNQLVRFTFRTTDFCVFYVFWSYSQQYICLSILEALAYVGYLLPFHRTTVV